MIRRRLFASMAMRSCLIAALAASGACSEAPVEQVETTATVPVTVEAAKIEDLQVMISATGTVTPAPDAELTIIAPETARIAELPKAEGDVVRSGDLLVRFDIPSLAAEVAARREAVSQASARLEEARAALTRLSSLLAEGVAARREVEDARRQQTEAEADVEQARTAVEAASALANRTTVVATFPGVVARRFHNPGDLVEAAAADPVLKVINPDRLQVVAAVPVAAVPRVVPGRDAVVRLPGRDETEAAKVLTKAAQVDQNGATANVRLAFVRPTSLASGTTVQVGIVGESKPKALLIPTAGIVEDEGEIFVMVAGADNKAHKYPVALGLSSPTHTEIVSGLKAGDRVIVRGQAELPEGAAITIEGQ